LTPPLSPLHPTEDAAALPPPAAAGMAALFTSHILRDGELVLLILKPSLWFIILQSVRFALVVGVFAMTAALVNGRGEYRDRVYFDFALLLVFIRLMWAVLQWQGRLYVLTDQRILRLSGIFSIDVFDCLLRKVAEVRPTPTTREKLLGLGTIEILPSDDRRLPAAWQTIARPMEIHSRIVAAINRAKQ
jgi:hypothetical protein